jgi:ribosomal protein L23
VQCINTKPKKRRLGRSFGTIAGFRKAIVTLKKGEKLDILPQ